MREKSTQLIKSCCTLTNSCCRDKVNRAASRRAVVMVFASPPRQFYRDVTHSYHLPGLSHLDNFAGTRKLASVYRDFAKTHANPDTDGNSPYHRAVMLKPQPVTRQIRLDNKGLSITSMKTIISFFDRYLLSKQHNLDKFLKTLDLLHFYRNRLIRQTAK